MRRPCIVDASSTLAWLLEEDPDPAELNVRIAAVEPVVPALWRLEVTGVVLKRYRTRQSAPDRCRKLLSLLDEFPSEVLPDPALGPLDLLFDIAKPHQLSSYDAVYLDAALRHRLPLLTHDRNLRLAAEAEGVEVL